MKRAYSNSSSGKPPSEPEEGGVIEELAAKFVSPWLTRSLKSEFETLKRKPQPDDVVSVLAMNKISETVTSLSESVSSGNLTAIKNAWEFRRNLQIKGLNAVSIV